MEFRNGSAAAKWRRCPAATSLALVLLLVASAGCGTDSVVGAPLPDIDVGAFDIDTSGLEEVTGSDALQPDGLAEDGSDTTATTDAAGDGTDHDADSDVLPIDTADDATVADADDAGTDAVAPDATETEDTETEDTGTDDASPGTDAEAGTDAATTTDTDTTLGTDAEAATDAASDTDAAAGTDALAADDAGQTDVVATTDAAVADAADALQGSDSAGESDAEVGSDAASTCDPSKCPALANPCVKSDCVNGACGVVFQPPGTPCNDGNACTTSDGCNAGSCAGKKVVCDDANPCSDDFCDQATGQCVAVANQAPCSDGNACTTGDACLNGLCGAGSLVVCNDGNVCTSDSCDPVNGCTTSPFAASSCDDGNDCTTQDHCSAGSCGGNPVACDDGNVCTKDQCVTGKGCLFTSATGTLCTDNNACTTADACSGGKCVGTPANCDDANPCTNDTCDAKDGCGHTPNSAGCDDGLVCTDNDKCSGGTCSGVTKVCTDNNPCTTDSCDAASGCLFVANSSPCVVGATCEKGTCSLGQCVGSGDFSCNDGNPCTNDTCTPQSGCQHTPVNNGNVCAAGTACVNPSTCQAGVCTAGNAVDCSDGLPCTKDLCDPQNGCSWSPSTEPCDDGNACTSGDVCGVVPGQGSQCKPGTPIGAAECTDNNACTTDGCNTSTGCTHLPANQGSSCNDNSACTVGETCNGGVCGGGVTANCDDGNPCTADSCNPQTGLCLWQSLTGPCSDNNACTAGDTCAQGKCTGTAVVCDDKNPCTSDACVKEVANCVFTPTSGGSSCSDGDACTQGDLCSAGSCVGSAKTCDDANVCTTDSCNSQTGACSFAPASGSCTPAATCQAGGTCSAGTCVTTGPLSCDDGNPCTTDLCNAQSGKCTHGAVSDATPCVDEASCTATSSCVSGECRPSAPCAIFQTDFPCGSQAGFVANTPPTTDPVAPRLVTWQVDNTPAVPDAATWGCTLNLNDGVDYCDPLTLSPGQCQLPTSTTLSPEFDLTVAAGLTPRVRFALYLDVDVPAAAPLSWGTLQIDVLGETGEVLRTEALPLSTQTVKVWQPSVELLVPEAQGHKVRLRFGVSLPGVASSDPGNTGAGIFVDNLKVDALWLQEDCSDGADNDGDGEVDCDDSSCDSDPWCYPVFADSFACSGPSSWQVFASNEAVLWAVDNTPASPVFESGDCAMNYNNGANYAATDAAQASVASSGLVQLIPSLSTAGMKSLWLEFRIWQQVEAEVTYDRLTLQVSTDNFAGCCALVCVGATDMGCTTTNTTSWVVPKGNMETWELKSFDLSQFAGKTIQVRLRFDTVDGLYNSGAGVFIDDLRIAGQ